MKGLKRIVFPGLVLAAAYYAVFGGEYSALELRRIRAEAEKGQDALTELRAETEALATRAEALEEDTRTIETLAREDHGMIRDGEVLYRFADTPEEK